MSDPWTTTLDMRHQVNEYLPEDEYSLTLKREEALAGTR